MSTIHSRTILVSLAVFLVAAAFGATPAMAACVSTDYSVNPGAPANPNWTDPIWIPAGSPGTGTCDTATNTNVSTAIIVNTPISNPLAGLTFNCAGCVIDIQAGGTLTIDGPGVVSGGAIVKVNGGTLVVNTAAVDGGVTFQSGTQLHLISGTVAGAGIINIDGGASVLFDSASSPTIDGVTLKNGGTFTLAPAAPATLTLTNGAIIDNWGTIDIQGPADIANGAGVNGIKNGGTLIANSGVTNVVSVKLDNLGGAPGVSVLSGTLSLAGDGNGNAPFMIGGGSTLDFPAGTYTMLTGGVVSGGGTLSVTGGTLSIGGVTEPDGFRLSSGMLTGDGFLSIGETFDWSGGTITGSGGSELAGGATGNFSGSDGVMTLDGRTFNNYGSIDFTSGTNALDLRNGAVLGVYGTFAISTDGSITCNCSTPPLLKVAPNGFFYKIGGAGTFLIAPPAENTASVASFSGTLQFAGGGTHGGNFYASAGNTVKFTSTTTFNPGSSVNADGTIAFASGNAQISGSYDVAGLTEITGGSVTINAASTTEDLAFAAGTLNLNDDFSMSGTGTWSGGEIQGTTGSFHVDSGATLVIDGALSSPTLDGVELVNDGLIEYTAVAGSGKYLTLSDEAVITNKGTFDIQTNAPIVEDGGFVGAIRGIATDGASGATLITNFGTLQKSAGAGTTDVEPVVDNAGDVKAMSGTLNFTAQYTQTAGSTILGPGGIQISSGAMLLNGGALTGSGTVTGDVQNSAQVAPGTPTTAGVINITSDYTQTSGGSLVTKLGGPSSGQFDQLTAGNTAMLDGTFTATLINSYAPADGTTFPVLTFSSNSGLFATENLPTYSPNGSFTSSYNPTSYELTAVVAPSSVDLRLQVNGPANVNAGAPLSYTITVDNLGPDPTSGPITVSNTLPAGATSGNGSGTGWSCGAPVAGVITCTNGTTLLTAQSLPALTISMTAPVNPGVVTNSATVSALTADPSLGNNTAAVNTNVVAQADLSIVKTGPGGVTSGQNIVYTISVTNNGPSQAVGVVVSDPTVAPLGFLSNSGACTNPYPCNLGTLNAGQTATITSTYTTPPNFDGDVTNTATVSATTNDPAGANNSSSATTNVGAQADLSIVKTGPALTSPGQDIVYTVTVTNNGPSPATNTTVSDVTPVGIAFLSNSGACATQYPCNVGLLNAGQSAVITSTYTVPGNYSGATVVNTASVASDVNDPDTSDNSSTTTASVAQDTDLSITKSGPVAVAPGQTVTYTITVTNDGPGNAANVVVSDPTPPGLTFANNTGACNTAFPCNVGTLAVGQSAVISATFNVPPGYPGASITNTATVSSDATELDAGDNTASATTTVVPASTLADVSILKNGPGEVAAGESVTFTISVINAGPALATGIIVADPTPAGLTFTGNSGACATPFPCNLGSLGPGQTASILSTYAVDENLEGSFTNTASVSSTTVDSIAANNSDTVLVVIACSLEPPQLLAPAAGATVGSPVAFSWTPAPDAMSYTLNIVGPDGPTVITTTVPSATATLPSGAYSWTVTATTLEGCSATSSARSFNVCGNPSAPVASVVGTLTTGQSYSVQWPEVDGASAYELQESSDAAFTAPVVTTLSGTSQSLTKNVLTPTAFFYRVRALFTSCGASAGPFSQAVRIVVVPLPSPNAPNVNVAVQAGSTQRVTFQLFIPGLPEGTTTFVATADKPWLAVTPTSGLIPPQGILVTISADPTSLTNGTWTGTIVVAYGTVSVSRPINTEESAVGSPLRSPSAEERLALLPTPDPRPPTAEGTTIKSIPISISLVTPITPSVLAQPGPNALVIPAAGHLSGAASGWFSDVRLANVSSVARKYQLTFNSGTVKKTTLDVDAGVTTALDDLVRNWYGLGTLGDSTNGVLIIEPLDANGNVIDDPVVSKATVVSSRTYNSSATSLSAGTLGQFIPATLFGNFIGRSGAASSLLSLQQVAESSSYRTNLGLAEAAGLPAQLSVSIFGATGARLFQLPLALNAGEQRQLNSFIAQNGLSLADGRIEVEVVGGNGKVTAYASVVDNLTQDPLVVSGVRLGGLGATRFVVPGVADLNTASANWRSDVRVFNSGAAPQLATLTFFPSSNPSASASAQVSVNPGEVKALDGILASLFQLHGVGGALHVTTAAGAPLVVTARTYNQTAAGTVGQFIPAVTDDEAVGVNDRALQIVQAEESSRYRTNLGITEISGSPVTVEVAVTLPDSKISPTVQIPLAANESRQLPILSSFGLGATYNARISVRVIEGNGRVTAYGSIIDQVTEDPTFVPAQ
jgi:uncharacterized repeat protein (TIGR01451 family)